MAWVEKHGSGFRIRYRLPDGTLTSETGFATRAEAAARAGDVEAEQRIGTFVDPRLAQTSVGEWVRLWAEAHDVSAGTWAKYDSHLRNHILPRFGAMSLGEINRMAIKAWVKTLRRSLAEPTVIDIVSLLSTILAEAVDEGLIGANPCRRLRLNTGDRTERPHATPHQVRELARRMNPSDALLVLTAAYTGMRWGELAGLRWHRVDLDTGEIHINRVDGALHEINGHHTVGRPKTPASVRTVHLPPFLTHRLHTHQQHNGKTPTVFAAPDGGWHRRSNFRRRVWLPAANGDPTRGWTPLAPGMHFHDLRHTHKTWLIEDGVSEVLQHQRLGHKLAGVRGVYSHTTSAMIHQMLTGLQTRWEQNGSTNTGDHYPTTSVVKISCSQSAPTTQKRPVGSDHQQAV